MLYAISFFLIAGLGLVILGLFQVQHDAPETTAARLERIRTRRQKLSPDYVAEKDVAKTDFVKGEEKRAAARRTTFLPSASNLFSNNPILARLEDDLMQARSQWRASELVAAAVAASLVIFIVLNLLTNSILLALPVALFCLVLPWIYVKLLRAKYYRRFDEQLSDTLMLMANSLKAGFSFLQTLEMVSREAQPPIADEFERVTQEVALGVQISDALENMGHRIKSMDLNLMITAVLIQREIGGSLAEILETIAAVIRERIRIKGEIRTLTTQGRMTGILMGMMPISLGLMLHFVTKWVAPNDPSFVEPLIHTPQGITMLIIAAVMQALGFATIMKIVAIKV